MKQQLLSAYRLLVPDAIKRRIPARLKAAALGAAYLLTGYPDLRLWQMRHLYKARPEQRVRGNIEDPLFSCSIQPDFRMDQAREATSSTPPGRFFAEFGFLGLKIKGQLTDAAAVAGGYVDLRLSDQLLRRLGVIPSNEHSARILYTIRRPTLDMFPTEGQISLHDASGRPLSVDLRYFPSRPEVEAAPPDRIKMVIPFGNGSLFDHISTTGPLDKKGWARPRQDEVHRRQQKMLELYARVRRVFEQDFDRPLFILYGTLLGQVREGDFIPGDDDFDVGYVSEERIPALIKAEAIRVMERLVACGFVVSLNHLGRPHRVRDVDSGAEIHLDNHIVFSPDGKSVWMHPRSQLPLSLDAFRSVEEVTMRGVEVLRPSGAVAYLAAHYGPGWRVPDPGYANIVTAQDKRVAQQLSKICLTLYEQRELARNLAKHNLSGDFVATALEQPYPIERWAQRVGF